MGSIESFLCRRNTAKNVIDAEQDVVAAKLLTERFVKKCIALKQLFRFIFGFCGYKAAEAMLLILAKQKRRAFHVRYSDHRSHSIDITYVKVDFIEHLHLFASFIAI